MWAALVGGDGGSQGLITLLRWGCIPSRAESQVPLHTTFLHSRSDQPIRFQG